jgi:hypothetical protein
MSQGKGPPGRVGPLQEGRAPRLARSIGAGEPFCNRQGVGSRPSARREVQKAYKRSRRPFHQSANCRSGDYLLGEPGLQVIDCFKCLTRRAGFVKRHDDGGGVSDIQSSTGLAPIWRRRQPRTGMQTRSPACARPRALVLGCRTRASRLRLGGRYWQHPGRSRPQMVLATAVRAKIIRAQQWLLRYDCMSTQTEVSG